MQVTMLNNYKDRELLDGISLLQPKLARQLDRSHFKSESLLVRLVDLQ